MMWLLKFPKGEICLEWLAAVSCLRCLVFMFLTFYNIQCVFTLVGVYFTANVPLKKLKNMS
jgi:hypothetical protein